MPVSQPALSSSIDLSDRLVKELALAGIATAEAANRFIGLPGFGGAGGVGGCLPARRGTLASEPCPAAFEEMEQRVTKTEAVNPRAT